MRKCLPLVILALVAGCDTVPDWTGNRDKTVFPKAERPVAPIVSSRWSDEESRDRQDEAEKIMDLASIAPGMTVADIGAGEGYYTIRLAQRVGAKGRVLAQDIVTSVRDNLAERVSRERLDNVSVKLGKPADPKLPDNSFDRILMVHMYQEIESPYEFLWRLRPALRPGGRVIVVDANRPTADHGTPPHLLTCEMGAIGYRRIQFEEAAFAGGYFTAFEAVGARPESKDIIPCTLDGLPAVRP